MGHPVSSIQTSSPNEVIIVAVDGWYQGTPSVTVDGSSATLIELESGASSGTSSLFYYTAPSAGSHSVVVSEGGLQSPYYLNFAMSVNGIKASGVVSSGASNMGSCSASPQTLSLTAGSYLVATTASFNVGGGTTGTIGWTGSPYAMQGVASLHEGSGIDSGIGNSIFTTASPITYDYSASDTIGGMCNVQGAAFPAAVSNQLMATPDPYTLSNTTIDVGQTSIANTIISNGISGTASYTGNWIWTPPASSNMAIGNTMIAALPVSTNALTITIRAVSANTLQMTFNGITYNAIASGTNTIYGTWTFNALVTDPSGDASPIPQLTNTVIILPACGNVPSSLIISCIPADMVNSQSTATPANFQQMFNALPFNALAGNVVVYNGISGALMPAWVESNSLIWVNLGSNTIAPYGSANNIYYFGLGPAGTNFFSPTFGNNIGEAPQLSPTYALYDNGNSIFTFYDNFPTGENLGAKWDTTAAASVVIGNGISFTGASPSDNGNNAQITLLSTYPRPLVIDEYGYVGGANPTLCIGYADTTGAFNSGYETYESSASNLYGTSYKYAIMSWSGGGGGAIVGSSTYTPPVTSSAVSTLAIGGSAITEYFNYLNPISATDTTYNNYHPIASSYWADKTLSMQWYRIRAYPPNGVMPAAGFAAQQSIKAQLTATPNPYTLSNTILRVGGISAANTVIGNGGVGTTSYTGNWIWYPPASSGIAPGNTPIALLANNALALTLNVVSANTLRLTFNGITYNVVAPGTNAIYGTWTLNAVVGDANGDVSPALTNTVTITPPLPYGLVAEYHTDYNWLDSSGNGNAATDHGATFGQPKLGTGSASFSGSGQYVVIPNMFSSMNSFTYSGWVYWSSDSDWQRIFDFGSGTTNNMFLTPGAEGAGLRFGITDSGNTGEQQLNTNRLSTGTWYYVAVTLNGTTGVLYVNGAPPRTPRR